MTASENIDRQIAQHEDWRGQAMSALRRLINAADSRLTEEWKWGGPVWTYRGNVCALGAFKDHVKVAFFKGARLQDPHGLFNAGLDAKESRSIDLREGERLDESRLRALIQAAVALNDTKK